MLSHVSHVNLQSVNTYMLTMYKQYKQFCWQSILLYEQLSSKADHFSISSGFMAGKQEGWFISAAPKCVCRLDHWGVLQHYFCYASQHHEQCQEPHPTSTDDAFHEK